MFETIKAKFWAVVGPVGSIIEARITLLVGLITGAIGFMDWSPLLSLFGESTDFNTKQITGLGAVIAVKGLVQEVVRRFNDPLLTVTKAADEAPEVAVAKKKIRKVLDKTPEVNK